MIVIVLCVHGKFCDKKTHRHVIVIVTALSEAFDGGVIREEFCCVINTSKFADYGVGASECDDNRDSSVLISTGEVSHLSQKRIVMNVRNSNRKVNQLSRECCDDRRLKAGRKRGRSWRLVRDMRSRLSLDLRPLDVASIVDLKIDCFVHQP